MSKLKCPICGNDLEQYHTGLVCYRHCLNGKNVYGSEETLKELDRTRKALDVAIDTINKAFDALVGCQEADNKYISDITAEDGLELLGNALGKIRFLQKD